MSLQGYIYTTYKNLTSTLGLPKKSKETKIKVLWKFECDNTAVSIYDWKQYDTPKTKNLIWNIDGESSEALKIMKKKFIKSDIEDFNHKKYVNICIIDDCKREAIVKGLCRKHHTSTPKYLEKRRLTYAEIKNTPEHKEKIRQENIKAKERKTEWNRKPENKQKKNIKWNEWYFVEENREGYLLMRAKKRKTEEYREWKKNYEIPQSTLDKKKIWTEKNKSRINRRATERYNEDVEYNLIVTLRNRINRAIDKKYINSSTTELLGCSIKEIRKHIESQFVDGMSWGNKGKNGWHIDHIIPINTFNIRSKFDLKKACHYTNLRPLLAKDNLSRPKDGSDLS